MPAPFKWVATLYSIESCECKFVVQCKDDEIAALLKCEYEGLVRSFPASSTIETKVDIQISRCRDGGYLVADSAAEHVLAEDVDSLLYCVDKILTIRLQNQRPDLFFLHGAALGWKDRAAIFSAPSGTGKSTAAWALSIAGFGYLSDELAPVDPGTLRVHPFSHALCLKSRPPAPYVLPATTLDAGRTLHVPTSALPGGVVDVPAPVAAFFFVYRGSSAPMAVATPLSAATVTAHLLSNVLNSLAHPSAGMEPAAILAGRIPGYALDTSDLPRACEAVRQILGDT